MKDEATARPGTVSRQSPGPAMAVLGIGNLLMGDEGFGVHVIRHLEREYRFPDQVRVHDAGTAGIYLGPILEDADHVLVVDVIRSDNPPGSLEFLDSADITGPALQSAMSPHQVGILEIIELCRLRDTAPQRVEFLCAVPERIALGLELSPTLARQVSPVAAEIVARIRRNGLAVEHA